MNYHLLNFNNLIPSPHLCTHWYLSDLNVKKTKTKKNFFAFLIFKNIHSKMRSVKIQVSLSHPA